MDELVGPVSRISDLVDLGMVDRQEFAFFDKFLGDADAAGTGIAL